MLHDVLFELGVEELPVLAVQGLGKALYSNMMALFREKQLLPDEDEAVVRCLATPRRLAIQCQLKSTSPDVLIEHQGPSVKMALDEQGCPTQALIGFSRRFGVLPQDLRRKETSQGAWFVYEERVSGQVTQTLLPSLVTEAVGRLPLAKGMRWGHGDCIFVRPVHWIVLLCDRTVLPLSLFGCTADQITYGHRFHAPQAIRIEAANEYEALLSEHYVIVDFQKRRDAVCEEVRLAAMSLGGEAYMPDALVDEVTSIVEWPVACSVAYAAHFLETVPKEVLMTSMQVHQKCFPVFQSQGSLLPFCIAISHIHSRDKKAVQRGYERVMSARLNDAAFFYAQDRTHALETYVHQTQHVIFQDKLGSLWDKSHRVMHLMDKFASKVGYSNLEAKRAAYLSKADLMTQMVGEFPELEGLMGYYYAQHAGEAASVAYALKEQYWPRCSGDQLPTTLLGQMLSLMDRIDTLVGIFGLGLKPTATKDPFKLRRHAVAVIRLLQVIVSQVPLRLSECLDSAITHYPSFEKEPLLHAVHTFILDRLPTVYDAMPVEWVQGVSAVQQECLYDYHQRMLALLEFSKHPEHEVLSAASKRVQRLLVTVDDTWDHHVQVNLDLFEMAIERELFHEIQMMEAYVQAHLSLERQPNATDFLKFLLKLSSLSKLVDLFFEQVRMKVSEDLLRHNRFALLYRLRQLFHFVADISRLF